MRSSRGSVSTATGYASSLFTPNIGGASNGFCFPQEEGEVNEVLGPLNSEPVTNRKLRGWVTLQTKFREDDAAVN